MQVFRIAHYANDLGPYQSKHHGITDPAFIEMTNDHASDSLNHPGILLETIRKTSKVSYEDAKEGVFETTDWLFGFANMFQLRDWFSNEELLLLHKHGFNLTVYEVDASHVCKLTKQVVFDKTNAIVLFKQNVFSLVSQRES